MKAERAPTDNSGTPEYRQRRSFRDRRNPCRSRREDGKDHRTVKIVPFDVTALAAIEKALRDSDLGVNPSNDGAAIRVVMPEMTAERRKEYTKLVNHKAEEARISIRNVRRHAKTAIDKLVKDSEIGEDEGARAEKELDAQTKKHIDQVDALYKHKEAELLEV